MKIKIMVLLTAVVVSIMLFVAGCLPPPGSGYYRHGYDGYGYGGYYGHGGHGGYYGHGGHHRHGR